MKKSHRIFLVLVACMFCTIALRSQILEDTFESGNFFLWGESPTLLNGTVGLVSEPVRSGSYAYKTDIQTNTGWVFRKAYISKRFSLQGDTLGVVFLKLHFNISSEFIHNQSSGTAVFATLAKIGVGDQARISLYNQSGNLYIYSDKGGRGNTILSRNTWHCVEMEYNRTAGEVRVWLDGVMETEITGQTLQYVDETRVGWNTNTPNVSGPLLIDDITISNAREPYSPYGIYVRHAPFFGHVGLKIQTFLAGQSATDKFRVQLAGDNSYQDDHVFDQDAPLEGTFDINLNLRNLNQGNYTLTYRLLNGNDSVLSELTETFSKPYDGLPITGINENSAVCVNGEPKFFVNSYGLNLNMVSLWAQKKYVNTLWGQPWTNPSLAYYQTYLDTAQFYGLDVTGPIIDKTWEGVHVSGDHFPNAEEIGEYIDAVGDNPSHLMYNWMDEPVTNHSSIGGGALGTIEMVKGWTETCHQLDPLRLVSTSEWATIVGMNTFQRNMMLPNLTADVYSFDYYPIEFAWGIDRGTTLDQYTQLASNYNDWNFGLVPFFSWVETTDVRPLGSTNDYTQYPPTQEQLRMITWIPIVKGSKGINWFHHPGQTPPENYAAMNEMVRMAESYGDIILSPVSKSLSVTDNANTKGNRVETMVRETDTDIYIFAARVTETTGTWVDPSESDTIEIQFTLTGGPQSGTVEDILYPQSVVHEEFDTPSSGTNFSFNLSQLPITPGSLIVGGGRGSGNSDVGYPTIWDYVYDNGSGILKPNDYWDISTATANYETGAVSGSFYHAYDAGSKKIHVAYLPNDGRTHSVSMTNGSFTDKFGLCGVRVYRIPKVPGTASSVTIGETNVLVTNDSGNDYLYSNKVTLREAATLQSMSFYVSEGSGNMRLGIYDATGTGGNPGTLLAQTSEFSVVIGWNTQNVITPVLLDSGNYWLAFQTSSSNIVFKKESTGTARWFERSYQNLPATFSSTVNTATKHWSIYATLVVDTIAPGVPVNLTADEVTAESFMLNWDASTDNVGVTSYEIFQDGVSIGTSDTTMMEITGLEAGTTYTMTVKARDAAENWSASSTGLNVTTDSVFITMGETNVLELSALNFSCPSRLYSNRVTLSETATIQSISIYVNNFNSGAKLRLGIFDATGANGDAGVLKAKTNEFFITEGWNTYDVITPVELTGGNYWLSFVGTATTLSIPYTSSGLGVWYTNIVGGTGGDFPDSISTGYGTRNNATRHWSIYATLNVTQSGGDKIGEVVNEIHEMTTGVDLQVYPNPSSSQTTKLQYTVGGNSQVSLKIYDVYGREVAVLLNEISQPAGSFTAQWSGSGMPEGVYLARLIILQDGKDIPVVLTREVLLMK